MPKTCGIEIKGSSAIVVLLEGVADNFKVLPTEFKKINLEDSNNQADVKAFSAVINSFLKTHNFDSIGIKARGTKGKFAGGAVSFKIEGLLQNTDYPVSIIKGASMKAKLKDIAVEFTGVNNYQIEAMKVAYYLLLEVQKRSQKSDV